MFKKPQGTFEFPRDQEVSSLRPQRLSESKLI